MRDGATSTLLRKNVISSFCFGPHKRYYMLLRPFEGYVKGKEKQQPRALKWSLKIYG